MSAPADAQVEAARRKAIEYFEDQARRQDIGYQVKDVRAEWWDVDGQVSLAWWQQVTVDGLPNPAWYVQVSYSPPGDSGLVYNDTVILDPYLEVVDIVPASIAELKAGANWERRPWLKRS